MSGGVDSSVAALLLKEQGYDCTGVFMKCWSGDGPDALVGVQCAWERDAEDARRAANHLGIPFYTFDFEKEYKKKVVEYMLAGYKKGITPNPDVMCNREIKFGLFLKKALSLGADFVATGHYVRIETRDKRQETSRNTPVTRHSLLFAARDASKDQSYFLWTLTQKELAHCLFPIGDYLKSEVREMARKAGLPTADKKDSQGICFLGDVDVFDFLKKHIKEKRGDILTTDGKKVGEHRGVWFYTIGQRHGLDIKESGKLLRREGAHETTPFYVAGKDVKKNILVVAEGSEDPALFQREATLTDVSFITGEYSNVRTNIRVSSRRDGMRSGFPVLARVRYRQPLVRASLAQLKTLDSKQKTRTRDSLFLSMVYSLQFEVPVKFVAPGQSAVFYRASGNPSLRSGSKFDDFELLGGGVIV